MADNDLEIRISTSADTSGAEEAKAAVEGLKESGGDIELKTSVATEGVEEAAQAATDLREEMSDWESAKIAVDTSEVEQAKESVEDLKEEAKDIESKVSVDTTEVEAASNIFQDFRTDADKSGDLSNIFGDFRSDLEKTEASMKDVGGIGREAFNQLQAPIAVTKQELSQNIGVLDRVKSAFSNFGTETKTAFSNFGTDARAAATSLGELIQHIPGFSKLGGVVTGLGAGTLGLVAAGFAAVGAAIGVAAKSLAEFAGKQRAVSDLDQILANTGQLTGEFRIKLQELADQFEETTGIGDERFLKVMSTLVKFGATSANIDQLTQATVNLSGAIGVDVERAATIMGKAMHGNVTMLQRYGITVDKNATDTEKLNQVMEQLATRGGGVLEARTRTLSGQFNQISIATGNFFEGLGNLMSRAGVLQDAMAALSTSINFFANLMPKAVEQTSVLKNNFDPLRKSMGDASEGADELSGAIGKVGGAAGKTKDALAEATEAIKANASAARDSLDASLKLAEAEIKLQVAQGKFSKEEGAIRIAQLRDETEVKRLLIEKNALLLQQAELAKAETEAKVQVQGKKSVLEAAEKRFASVPAAIEPNVLRLGEITPEEVLKRAQRAEAEVQRLEAMKPGSFGATLFGRPSMALGTEGGKTEADLQAELEAARQKSAGLAGAVEPAQELIRARAAVTSTTEAVNQRVKELDPKIKAIEAELSATEIQIKAANINLRAGQLERVTERKEIAEKEAKKIETEASKEDKEYIAERKRELADAKRDLALVEKAIKAQMTRKGSGLSELERAQLPEVLEKGETPVQARTRLTRAVFTQEESLKAFQDQTLRTSGDNKTIPKTDDLKSGIDKLGKDESAERIVREMTTVVIKAHETQAQKIERLRGFTNFLKTRLDQVEQREQVNKAGAN